MRKNWRIALLGLSLAIGGAVLTTGTVLAQPPTPASGGTTMTGCAGGGWLAALNLTPDQLNKGRRIRIDAEKQLIQAKADMKMQKLDLKDALMQDNIDQNLVGKIASQVGGIATRMVNVKAKMVSDLMGILTPEQRQKARMMMMMMEKDGMGMHDGKRSKDHDGDLDD